MKISGLIAVQKKKKIWACHPPSPNGAKGLKNLLELIWKCKTCLVFVPQTARAWNPAADLETEALNSSAIQNFHLLIFYIRKATDIWSLLMLSVCLQVSEFRVGPKNIW